MKKPLYTTAAHEDLIGILSYISQDKQSAFMGGEDRSQMFANCFAARNGRVETEVGPRRCNVVGRYVIFHRKHEDTAEILRVILGDRNITRL